MTTCLGKCWLFGSRVSLKYCQFSYLLLPFGFVAGICDRIVLVADNFFLIF